MTQPSKTMIPWKLLLSTLRSLLCVVPLFAQAAEEFLPPEEAFRFEARAADARTVEVVFQVVDGYYLYREQFKFAADGGARLGAAVIPAGKVKFDETFGKDVETHRGRVVIRLPVEAAPASFKLTVTSQGCADAGLCYPPMTSDAQVSLAGFGGSDSVTAEGPVSSPAVSGGAARGAFLDVPSGSGELAIDRALRDGRWWAVVGVFFAAGVLLSFTPCVLPMLPILSSIIVGDRGARGGEGGRARGLLLAGSYSLGMAVVYTALGVAAGLAGEGLAAALQTPWVLGAFAALLALLAMSMFGFYELQLPGAARNRLAVASSRLPGGKLAGVFAMGGVSALIVSPCVAAPLAGALLYISQTRDVALGGSALFFLAAGMSVPLLLVGTSAGALLPRAGAWMEGVKHFFGLMLLGVAWWTVSPVLPGPVAVAGWGALLLGAATFMGAFDRIHEAAGIGGRLAKAAGLAVGLVGATQIVGAAAGADDALQPLRPFASQSASIPRNAEPPLATAVPSVPPTAALATPLVAEGAGHFRRIATLAELDEVVKGAGRPVMLDFYADWCVSCKEMERFTFSDPAIRERMANAVLLQADVTRNTEADRALLKRFSLFGPPGIVFFDAAGQELSNVRVIGYQNPQRFAQSLGAAGL